MTAERRLEIDAGAPPAVDEPDSQTPDGAGFEPPTPPGPLPGELPEWEVRSVGFLLGVIFMGLHLTVGRAGPDDAFIPSDAQRREMAAPLAATMNRSARARRYAPAGDGLAFLGIAGEFVLSETARVKHYRQQGGEPPAPPDADLAGIGTVAHTDPAGPQMRPWRPPIVPDGAP